MFVEQKKTTYAIYKVHKIKYITVEGHNLVVVIAGWCSVKVQVPY